MEKKKLIIILCLLIFISGLFLIDTVFEKRKNNELNNKVESISEDEKIDSEEELEVENESMDILKKDENEIKKMGIEFVKLVHGYSIDGSHKGMVEEASKLATESYKGFLIGEFINSKQPILFERFKSRVVKDVKAIECKKSEENSLFLELEVWSNIINMDEDIVSEEHNIVKLLFIKENNEWKVGEYATSQYR